MAFFAGRFDPIVSEVETEVKDLYRIRDNDEQYKNEEGSKVSPNFFGNNNLDSFKVGVNKKFQVKPSDPIWLKMTEAQRIENGLQTRHTMIQSSFYGLFITMIYAGFAMSMYARIYYPGGIILRNQRREGVLAYLKKRLPLTLLFFYSLYMIKGRLLRSNIDFYSVQEEAIEKELELLTKH